MLALPDRDLSDALRSLIRPPFERQRVRLDAIVARQFTQLRDIARATPCLQFAYSVKTNPGRAYLEAARAAGLDAETISTQELRAATELRFETTIYNGPYPAWRCTDTPSIAFADSIVAYRENARRLKDTLVGIRIRPAAVASRFGIPANAVDLQAAVRTSGRSSTAVSFHVRPEDYAGASWRDIAREVLGVAERIDAEVPVVAFDFGGGWTSEEFDAAVGRGDLTWLCDEVSRRLRQCERIIGEPGQAVVTPCEAIVAPILERRADAIIVDAGYPEYPQMSSARHRLFYASAEGTLQRLADGETRIEGNTCLEYDRFDQRVALPHEPREGDAVIVADCGGYDASMSFSFAKVGQKMLA